MYGPRGRGLGTRFSFRWNNQVAWITVCEPLNAGLPRAALCSGIDTGSFCFVLHASPRAAKRAPHMPAVTRQRRTRESHQAAVFSLAGSTKALASVATAVGISEGLRGLARLQLVSKEFRTASTLAENVLRVLNGKTAAPLPLTDKLAQPLYLAARDDGSLVATHALGPEIVSIHAVRESCYHVQAQVCTPRVTRAPARSYTPLTIAATSARTDLGMEGALRGVAVDRDGAVYVVHRNESPRRAVRYGDTMRYQQLESGHIVSKLHLNLAGRGVVQQTSVQEGPHGGIELAFPSGLCLHQSACDSGAVSDHVGVGDGGSSLFVSDVFNHRVVQYDTAKLHPIAIFGTFGTGLGCLLTPYGLASHGRTLYVADNGNDRISCFDIPSGHARRPIGQGWLVQPRDIALVRSGEVAIVSECTRLDVFAVATGQLLQVVDLGRLARSLWGLTVDGGGKGGADADDDDDDVLPTPRGRQSAAMTKLFVADNAGDQIIGIDLFGE